MCAATLNAILLDLDAPIRMIYVREKTGGKRSIWVHVHLTEKTNNCNYNNSGFECLLQKEANNQGRMRFAPSEKGECA